METTREDFFKAEREDVARVQAQLMAIKQAMIDARRPVMIIYLIEMAVLECEDVITQQGNYAPGKRH